MRGSGGFVITTMEDDGGVFFKQRPIYQKLIFSTRMDKVLLFYFLCQKIQIKKKSYQFLLLLGKGD